MGRVFSLVAAGVLAFSGAVSASPGIVGAVRVIDGDTFIVGQERIRLHGIDAPESGQICHTEQGIAWSCGLWVSQSVQQRFQGKTLNCDPLDMDRYGRTVARCWSKGEDVARQLVRDGLAYAYRKYSMDYDGEEIRAAKRDVGLHASHLQSPSQFRITRAQGRIPPDRSCAIKGNISGSGAHIYHSPGQQYYERTGIRPENGERWFCTKIEAETAGWRAAKR